MSEWKDKFRRPGDEEPEGSEIKFGCFRLCVHHYFGCPKEMWFGSCYPDVFSQVELKSTILGEAKSQAKAMLQAKLEEAYKAILHND